MKPCTVQQAAVEIPVLLTMESDCFSMKGMMVGKNHMEVVHLANVFLRLLKVYL